MTKALCMVDLSALSTAERSVSFTADERDRRLIAERLDLPAVGRFELTATARRARGGGREGAVAFDGHIVADVTQSCVVTLEPVEAHHEVDFAVTVVPEEPAGHVHEVHLDVDDEDVEVVPGDLVDLGDLAVQYLALALDPYPRKPSLEAPGEQALAPDNAAPSSADPQETGRPNPFAVLRRLKDNA